MARSAFVMSGLMEIPGDSLRFFRPAKIEGTSHVRESLTSIGVCLSSLYFPYLTQS